MTQPAQPGAARVPEHRPAFRPGFLPALEGLRAVASIGIIGTHAAFQTGHDTGALWERALGRFDFFVAVFFTLSGFLLWRSHRGGGREGGPQGDPCGPPSPGAGAVGYGSSPTGTNTSAR